MAATQRPIIDSASIDKREYKIYATEGNAIVIAVSISEASIIEKNRKKYKGTSIPDNEIVQGIILKIRSGKYYIPNQITHDFKINELSIVNGIWG